MVSLVSQPALVLVGLLVGGAVYWAIDRFLDWVLDGMPVAPSRRDPPAGPRVPRHPPAAPGLRCGPGRGPMEELIVLLIGLLIKAFQKKDGNGSPQDQARRQWEQQQAWEQQQREWLARRQQWDQQQAGQAGAAGGTSARGPRPGRRAGGAGGSNRRGWWSRRRCRCRRWMSR